MTRDFLRHVPRRTLWDYASIEILHLGSYHSSLWKLCWAWWIHAAGSVTPTVKCGLTGLLRATVLIIAFRVFAGELREGLKDA